MAPGAAGAWRELHLENSETLVHLAGSATASAWTVLPHPAAYYNDATSGHLNALLTDCLGAQGALNLTPYYGVNIVQNRNVFGAQALAWGGQQSVTLNGVSKLMGVAWY